MAGEYALSSNFSLVVGLKYSQLGYDVEYNFNAFQPNDPVISVSGSTYFSYSQVQILTRFYVVKKKNVLVFVRVGFAPDFLLTSREETLFADGVTRSSSYLNKFNISILSGVGIKFKIRDKYTFLVGIPLNLYVRGFDSFMENGIGGGGLLLGVIYKFKAGECDTCPSFI